MTKDNCNAIVSLYDTCVVLHKYPYVFCHIGEQKYGTY